MICDFCAPPSYRPPRSRSIRREFRVYAGETGFARLKVGFRTGTPNGHPQMPKPASDGQCEKFAHVTLSADEDRWHRSGRSATASTSPGEGAPGLIGLDIGLGRGSAQGLDGDPVLLNLAEQFLAGERTVFEDAAEPGPRLGHGAAATTTGSPAPPGRPATCFGWHRQAHSCLRRNDVTPAEAGVGDGSLHASTTPVKARGLGDATPLNSSSPGGKKKGGSDPDSPGSDPPG